MFIYRQEWELLNSAMWSLKLQNTGLIKLHLHVFVWQEWCSFLHGNKYLWFYTDEVLLIFKDHLFTLEIIWHDISHIWLRSDGFLASFSTFIVVYSGSLYASFESVGPEKGLAQARFATSLFKVILCHVV